MIIFKTLASYDFMHPSEKQWCVQMFMPDKSTLSEKWPEDEEPDIEGVPPSQVLNMIEDRLKSYLFCSGRDETLARIAAYRERAADLDDAWARKLIEHHEGCIRGLRVHLTTEEEPQA